MILRMFMLVSTYSHYLIDQMNDPILVLKNTVHQSDLPNVVYEGYETPGLDVISFRQNENDINGYSPAMIRLRNRSYQSVNLHNILFSIEKSGQSYAHIAIIMPMKYGYSDRETLKNLSKSLLFLVN